MILPTSEGIAVYAESSLTYRQLLAQANALAETISQDTGLARPLVLLKLSNSVNAIIAYLACLQAKYPVILMAHDQDTQQLEQQFQVNYKITAIQQHVSTEVLHAQAVNLYPELRVLLSTSGSTGNAKLVMLSETNLVRNAQAIAEYLNIDANERALTSLPFNYSYGLSILNSHLLAGASLVVTEPDILSKKFWQQAKRWQATSFAGVPFSYEMLCRLGLARAIPESITTLTQAGGHLKHSIAQQVASFAIEHKKRFFIMYGQTEATARISYLPETLASDVIDCIGKAIPGGVLSLRNTEGYPILQDEQVGELYYQGDNVMLGYAQSPQDLLTPSLPSILATGDLALCRQGLYYLQGRIKRMIKLRSRRFNLDDLERKLTALLQVSELVCCGEDDNLYLYTTDEVAKSSLHHACNTLQLPVSLVRLISLQSIPKLANGKIDYPALAESD